MCTKAHLVKRYSFIWTNTSRQHLRFLPNLKLKRQHLLQTSSKLKQHLNLNFSSCINVLPGGSAVRAQVQGARQHGELRRVRGRTTEDTRHGEVRQGVCRFLKSQPQTSVPGTFERRQTFNPNKIPYYIYIHVSSHKAANTQQKAPFFSRRFVSKNYTDVPPSVFVHICNILFHYLIFFKVIFLLSSRIFCFPFFCTCYWFIACMSFSMFYILSHKS